MGKIVTARCYANNEVAFIAWDIDEMIPGCLGFDIVRIMEDGSESPKGLATFVPFAGQSNPSWAPQDTGVWPVQKLSWRDLTLRRHRSDIDRRPAGFTVKYSIRPVGKLDGGLEPVPVRQPKAYDGAAIRLGYLGDAVETNPVSIQSEFGGVRAAFTNGILSGQWLKHAIESDGKAFDANVVRNEIARTDSAIRAYLTGDVLDVVTSLVRRARDETGFVRLALYELHDPELVSLLLDNKDILELILSNSGKERNGDAWDVTNHDARDKLKQNGVRVHDRMFNNDHIGHNKFAVYFDTPRPKPESARAVMTGSTNWTSTGLCGQTNNAMVLTSDAVARGYAAYWERLLADPIETPEPPTAGGHSHQGPELRNANQTPVDTQVGTADVQLWYSPNTEATTKREAVPVDLSAVFNLMKAAKQAIFFLAFLPSRAGKDSIISAAIDAAATNPELLVAGAISDVTAMPGYVAPDKNAADEAGRNGVKPFIDDSGHLHIVRAAEIKGPVGDFETEILKVGNAAVHDKIVVIDPLSPDCLVVTGSHNQGFKASYENDENLVIIHGNQSLAQAYAVHVLDVYDHYRFRAWQAKEQAEGKTLFDGHIYSDDHWLRSLIEKKSGDIAQYFALSGG
ncbi:phosphatidylserine/phosphatidylglycerophosphate/cardiolipin synthase-like enzyme [Paraburkholderia terricola]|uniref:phospholipase D-like domain-containing protein n=1 Tax=Paraburkholderia terricola TaxID=169427 RepID=UPI00285EAE05|nr:phospholipase D-like domain-containing protein [Paraburkholderia terricola]MDR6496311.1 phosphatidylserine/phosphatidylglycerophosphate/cardiolipin synthase-like enzyme [Paraburkholderia terricola]